ncbi:putative nuclease HARBI1 [Periplaneta americana]|uniref:putative nuclease HARBI1 n=1 Tax=Periplaneta americana TaxID=6978 RepID=UPI0037E870E6
MSCALKRKKLCSLLVLLDFEAVEEEIDYLVHHYCIRKSVSEVFLCREEEGVFRILIEKHLLDDEVKFKAYFRFTREQFYFLVNLIQDDLSTKPCNRVKRPISPAEKLALTLRFLATGESFHSLAFSYRISPSSISTFVPQVLQALKRKLLPRFLPNPNKIDWETKAEEFWDRWDFPNVVAALDGKHVRIVAPNQTGTLFYNYKGYFSIVLLAMVDANYKFLVVDVGSYGKEGDAGSFNKSEMGQLVKMGSIFPPPRILQQSNILLPHVILGDEAFRLDKHIMKPYCRRQILEDEESNQLSKARRVSENAFGIMCSTFRNFFTPINVEPETVDLIVTVCCCLHNLLRDDYIAKPPCDGETQAIIDELPADNMIPLAGTGGFAKSEGFKVRSRFTEYFNGKYFKTKASSKRNKRK